MNRINEYDADILERRVHFTILFEMASEFPFTFAYFDRAGIIMPQCLYYWRNTQERVPARQQYEHTHIMHEYVE
jgi:hypothetical protein